MNWNRYGRVCFLLFAGIFLWHGVSEAGEVCKRICIQGYDDFCQRAHSYQEPTTHQIDHVKIYVERAKDGTFNFASNVLTEGTDYATKIVGFEKLTDLDNVFFNLDDDFQKQLSEDPDKVLQTFHDTAEVYVTSDVLKDGPTPKLDTSGVKNIHVLPARR